MLDDLLGRTPLKERIEELEREVERLENQLEAESERRAEAVTEKQEAEREINQLQSKIEELEDRVRRAEESDTEVSFRKVEGVQGENLEEVLSILESVSVWSDDEGLTTAFVKPGDEVPYVLGTQQIGLVRKIDSETGLVIYADDPGIIRVGLVPPLPVRETRTLHDSRFIVDRSLFQPEGSYALGVLRSDSFAGAVYEDDRIVESAFVSSSVKSKHSKGGWSQRRFERIRDDQVRDHLNRSVEEFEDLIDSFSGLRFVAVAGESGIIGEFADEINREDVFTRPVDARGEKEDLLEGGYRKFWTSRLYVL